MRAARATTPRQNRPHILVASDNARLPGWFQHRFMGAIYSSPRSSEDCLRILRQTASQSVYGLHATCVSVMGHGIVIVGAPGAGKSRLALDLIRRGHTLIADDHVLLMQNGAGEWRAVGPAAWYGWLHLRHAGFFDIKRLDGCRINGVETLSGIVSLNHTEAEQKKELAKSGFSALANIPILLRTRYAPELTAAIVEREVDSCLEVRNATARRIA